MSDPSAIIYRMTEHANNTDGPTDELFGLAAQVSMAIDLHKRLTIDLTDKVHECFETDADIDLIARNSNLPETLIESWRNEWLKTDAGIEWRKHQDDAARAVEASAAS